MFWVISLYFNIPPGTPCIKSTNVPPIMIINRIYETENLLPLYLVSFLVGLRTYQHPCKWVCLGEEMKITIIQGD